MLEVTLHAFTTERAFRLGQDDRADDLVAGDPRLQEHRTSAAARPAGADPLRIAATQAVGPLRKDAGGGLCVVSVSAFPSGKFGLMKRVFTRSTRSTYKIPAMAPGE